MRAMNRYSMILGAALAVATSACGQSAAGSKPTSVPAQSATTHAAAAPISSPDDTSGTERRSVYATKVFNRPFDVTIPEWLDSAPAIEQPNFVTWQSSTVDRAVRFLIPVSVFPPGSSTRIPPPHDYLDYLLAQTDHGAHFTDEVQTTVSGMPTTIVTALSHHTASCHCPYVPENASIQTRSSAANAPAFTAAAMNAVIGVGAPS